MRRLALAVFAIILLFGLASSFAQPTDDSKEKPTGEVGKLPANWSQHVTVKDLTDEIAESATRMGQNLKKASDFDKFLDKIKTEGHLTAILAALVQEHAEAGNWKGTAAEIQVSGLEIAKAAAAKGGKNFRSAADAHKKLTDQLKKGDNGDRAGAANGRETLTDWTSLGALADVMKRVEPSYKYIRGKLSDEAAFKKDLETVRHNSAILYAVGQVSPALRPSESDMVALSGAMNSAVISMLDAAKTGDLKKAKEADTAINASCQECHKVKRFQKKGSEFDF